VDFFGKMETFEEIMVAPSRWPCFAFNSEDHIYVEELYRRRGTFEG
jgi:hypothetical protein